MGKALETMAPKLLGLLMHLLSKLLLWKEHTCDTLRMIMPWYVYGKLYCHERVYNNPFWYQNLTLLASVNMADKQAVLYGAAFDRAGLVTYKYMDAERRFLGNYSTDVLRNSVAIPDVTLPRHTRFIVRYQKKKGEVMDH